MKLFEKCFDCAASKAAVRGPKAWPLVKSGFCFLKSACARANKSERSELEALYISAVPAELANFGDLTSLPSLSLGHSSKLDRAHSFVGCMQIAIDDCPSR